MKRLARIAVIGPRYRGLARPAATRGASSFRIARAATLVDTRADLQRQSTDARAHRISRNNSSNRQQLIPQERREYLRQHPLHRL